MSAIARKARASSAYDGDGHGCETVHDGFKAESREDARGEHFL